MRRNVSLVALAFLAMASLPSSRLAGAPPSKEKTGTLALGKGGSVRLDTYKGTVRISSWDRQEVLLKARIEPDESCSDDARKVADTEVEFEVWNGDVKIRSNYDRLDRSFTRGWFSGWWNGACKGNLPLVHYEITMPASAPLSLKDHKSKIDIAGLAGDLFVDTYKGDSRLTGLTGALDLETYKGTVRVETALAKDLRAETYKGTVTLVLPRDAAFELDAELGKRGDLRSDFPVTSGARRYDDRKTRGVVGHGGPRVRLETYKGSFRLEAAR